MKSLGSAEMFAAGAVGEPGARTFFLYIRVDDVPYWIVAEKQQVAALGEHALQLLTASEVTADPVTVEQILNRLALPEPGEPLFRVGAMALNVSADRQLVTVILEPVDEEEEGVSFDVTPAQLQAMALSGLDAVGKGRPICDLCRLPKEPDGHRCPSTNGHHTD